jgi:hypothetical protein
MTFSNKAGPLVKMLRKGGVFGLMMAELPKDKTLVSLAFLF